MDSVSIGVWIGVGGRYEDSKFCGMSHLLEHMLFKGTYSRTRDALKEAIEGVGGSFNGFTSEEVTCYLVKLPSKYLGLGLDILSDMVLNPQLDPAELEKEKRVISEEIKMYIDQPSHHVFDILAETMWPDHALGRPIAGYINTVKNFKRGDLADFKDRYYQPANMSIVVTGKVDSKKTLKFAKGTFFMPSARKNFAYHPAKKTKRKKNIRLLYKRAEQIHVAFGLHSINRTHKMRYAIALLNIILGGNMSSRLFERLREKKPLCYDISSSVKKYKETGAFVVHAGIGKNKFLEASTEIIHELKNIKNNFVTPDELYRAKEYIRGQLLLALEDTTARMLWLGERITSEEKAPSVREIFKNVEKVSVLDIKRIANMIFNKKNLNFAAIGPINASDKNRLKKALTL